MSTINTLYQLISKNELWEETRLLKRNEFLIKEGETDTHLYFVVRGSLRVFIANNDEDLTIRFGYKDNFIAALDSYINQQPTAFYIQALRETEVKAIAKNTFSDFMKKEPDRYELWHQMMEGLIYQQMERERDILTSSPKERYERVLKRSPQLFQEIPHKYIASYLRMTPETLSRIKASQ